MFKILLLLITKEIIETISNKRKLWPFILTLIPIFMFFYTKGSESLFAIGTTVYTIPILIIVIISMQISSTSILNEKNTKMLDIILAMKTPPIIIVFAKNLFSSIFAICIGFSTVLLMKISSIIVFKEDLLGLNIHYIVFLFMISYFASIITFLVSVIIRELSVIPIISSILVIITIFGMYKFLTFYNINIFFSNSLFIINILIVIINIVMTVVNSYLLTKSKYIMSI